MRKAVVYIAGAIAIYTAGMGFGLCIMEALALVSSWVAVIMTITLIVGIGKQ